MIANVIQLKPRTPDTALLCLPIRDHLHEATSDIETWKAQRKNRNMIFAPLSEFFSYIELHLAGGFSSTSPTAVVN